MDPSKPCVLIVEDDEDLAQWVQDYLVGKGYEALVTYRGDDAVTLIQEHNPDIVILDGMLPGMDGVDVCKTVRPAFTNAIIMLTARDEEIDEVLGLEMGADEYLTKPVRARALLARIRKHIDRQQVALNQVALNQVDAPVDVGQSSEKLTFNNLVIDRQAMVVSLDDVKVKVSSKEFDVLWLLAKKSGQLVTRKELVSELRGFDYDGFDRSIDLRISRLRKKLHDNPQEPFRIKTIWGKGYFFAKDAW